MTLYLFQDSDNHCTSHDGYIQIGSFPHSSKEHMRLNPDIEWVETYWVPDCFGMRYKRASFQRTEKMNEGSPKTDNATDSRPRDFPDQAQTRLNRTL
jgi:hypothetical protein